MLGFNPIASTPIAALEAVEAGGGAQSAAIVEAVSAADSQGATVISASSATEAATSLDSGSASLATTSDRTEAVTSSEASLGTFATTGALTETTAPTDAQLATMATASVITEAATLADSVDGLGSTPANVSEGNGDPFFSNVALLLHGDGTPATSTFTDSSSSPKTLTAVGDPQHSATQVKFGGTSIFFDGVGDVVQVSASDDFSFGTGDFTIEMWANRLGAGSGDRFLIDRGNGSSFLLRWNAAGTLQFFINATQVLARTFAFTTGTWFHIAVVRSGSACTLYINGVSEATGSSSANITSAAIARLGGYEVTSSDYFHGYLDEARVTKGVARYTTGFTPATAAFPEVSGANDSTSSTSASGAVSSVTESATSADTVAAALAAVAAQAEAASLAESVWSSQATGAARTEPLTAGEVQAAVYAGVAVVAEAGALVDTAASAGQFAGSQAEVAAAGDVAAGAGALTGAAVEFCAVGEAVAGSSAATALAAEIAGLVDASMATRATAGAVAEVGSAGDTPGATRETVAETAEAGAAMEGADGTRLVPVANIAEDAVAAELLQGIVLGSAGVAEEAAAVDGFEAIRYSTGAVNESPGSGYGNLGEVVDAIWRHRNALTVARYLTDGDGPLLSPVDIPPELADLVDAVWADTRALSQSKYQILRESH